MAIQDEKFGFTVRDSNGAPWSGQLVELRKGATIYTFTELGTSGFYTIDIIPTGKYSVYINAVDSEQTMPVGAGQVAALGNELDNTPVSTGSEFEFKTAEGLKIMLSLDNVTNVAVPVPTPSDENKVLKVDSNGDYELGAQDANGYVQTFEILTASDFQTALAAEFDDKYFIINRDTFRYAAGMTANIIYEKDRGAGIPGGVTVPISKAVWDSTASDSIPASNEDGAIVIKNTDNSTDVADGSAVGQFTWDELNGRWELASEMRINDRVTLVDTIDATFSGGEILVDDPTLDQQVASKKYVDDNAVAGVASFYTQTFIEADLVGRILTITHNLDSEDILLTLFDANKKVYIPDEYQVIDANNVEVTIDEIVVGINKIVACANAQVGAQNPPSAGGFMDYNDTSTTSTPINLSADTWTTIPNDGLGAFTNKTYRPDGNSIELIDTATGSIDTTGLSLGDTILIRNDFTVVPNTNNASLLFRYQLGSGANSYTLEKRLGRLDEGSGSPYRFSLSPTLSTWVILTQKTILYHCK